METVTQTDSFIQTSASHPSCDNKNKNSAKNRSSRLEVFCRKGVLRDLAKFTGKNLCLRQDNFIKKESPAQVFSCEFCEISKNTFF